MKVKCDSCGKLVEVEQKRAKEILEKKKRNPRATILCGVCFGMRIPVPHKHYDPETGYSWREAP